MTDEQLAELAPWSEKLQSIKNRRWMIVNYSNSQRAGVILNFTAVLFGGYFQIIIRYFYGSIVLDGVVNKQGAK